MALLAVRAAAQQPDAHACAELRTYVYTLQLHGDEEGYGRGIFVSKGGTFLTALHLFEQWPHSTGVFIQLYDGTFWVNHPVETVTAFSRALDVAIVKVHLGGAKVNVPPMGSAVRVGDWVSGFRSGVFEVLCTAGQVSAAAPNKITIRGNRFLLPGSSGSPIFDSAGRVVGIAVEMLELYPGTQHSDYLYNGVPIGKALSMPRLSSPVSLRNFLSSLEQAKAP